MNEFAITLICIVVLFILVVVTLRAIGDRLTYLSAAAFLLLCAYYGFAALPDFFYQGHYGWLFLSLVFGIVTLVYGVSTLGSVFAPRPRQRPRIKAEHPQPVHERPRQTPKATPKDDSMVVKKTARHSSFTTVDVGKRSKIKKRMKAYGLPMNKAMIEYLVSDMDEYLKFMDEYKL